LQPKVAQDDKVLVTVVTDGYENASREYSSKAIKALVDQLKAQGWVFAYIGANHDVEVVAASLSITNTMCFETTDDGVKKMSERLSNSRACWYDKVENRTADSEEDNKSFFAKWFGK
jgi:predicted outer membrane lipoprotein